MEQERSHICVQKEGPCVCLSVYISPQSCDLHLCSSCWLQQCKKNNWDHELSACANRICDTKNIVLKDRRELTRRQVSSYLGLKRPIKSGHIARSVEPSNLKTAANKQARSAKVPTENNSTLKTNNKRMIHQISSDEDGSSSSLLHAPIPTPPMPILPIVSAPYLDVQNGFSMQHLGVNITHHEVFLPNFVRIQDRHGKYDQCMFSLCQDEVEPLRNEVKFIFDKRKDELLVMFFQKWCSLFQKKILYVHSFLQAEASKKKDMLMYYYYKVNDPSNLAIIQCLVNSSDITRHYMFLYKELSNAYKFFDDQAKISGFRPIIFYRVTLGKFILMVKKPAAITTTTTITTTVIKSVSLPLKKRPVI